MDEWIKRKDCASAEELLTELSSHTPDSLYTGRSQTWLFRGQSEDKPLLPSAHREGGFDRLMHLMVPGQNEWLSPSSDERRTIEFQAFGRFAALADAEGHEVPGDSPRIRFPPLEKIPDGPFPPEEFLGIAALAQHHGVPTCVLDWTRDSRIGAYFAAARACRRMRERSEQTSNSQQRRLVIYALNVESLNILRRAHFDETIRWEWDPMVRLVTVPYASNPNLRRQRGVFTLVQSKNADDWPPPPLNEALLAGCTSFSSSERRRADDLPEHPLQRFTLPWREAPRLLYFLGQHGVSAASVFDGRDAVFRAMEEGAMMKNAIPGG